ncbi:MULTISPECIES: SDR family oxidoreductase [unclassified Microbacterium]|uniref:SDR family oxidoreductase n=1 Tax=unclassified Microbacterium TaxID=2609290 RepID=UPI0021A77787|nr:MULTISPECIES: SDR family oxidoreductase [unclassified Microbacterium]MCT1364088.1 SDR family oxidoreductase [Microbacterium sp. p3-SID131]MCT1375270.1 SDR family oxidoreductase [Microbacterium sp. p3-SID337]
MSEFRSGVFVTGATGSVGAAVVSGLLGKGERVVAAVRSDSAAEQLPAGAEARVFDFGGDADAMRKALEGCDRLFLMRPPPIEDVERYLFPLIDAAMRLGIRQIVFLSLQGVEHNKGVPHYRVEKYLERIRAPYTFLRPNFFMQNLSTTYRGDIRDRDQIFLPAGHAFTAFIDAHDIGAVAAAVLTSSGHINKKYTLNGEQTLTYRNVAKILSDVLGRRIQYLRPSEDEYLARLAEEGYPKDYIDVQKMIYRVVRFNISAFPNRSVRRLTGRPATTFRKFAERERAAWER